MARKPRTKTTTKTTTAPAVIEARVITPHVVIETLPETPAPAETLLERGRRKALRKGADLLAVNRVGWTEGFEVDANAVLLLDRRGELVAEARGDKRAVADALWDGIREIRAER